MLAGLVVLGAGRIAYADRYEASLHAQVVGGAAAVGDAASADSTVAPLAGVGMRASYTRSNALQYDAQLTLAGTGAATFDRGAFRFAGEAVTAPFSVVTRLVRLDLGVTLRLGVRVIPTARLALGVEERFRGAPVVQLDGARRDDADGRPGDRATDVVGIAAVGVDYRFGPRLIVGGSIGGSAAVVPVAPRWLTVEATVHVAYYWYPLWFD